MEPFTAASHHDVLALVVQISVLLLSARVLAEVAQRLGQPSVVGELLAGILLGPSLLSGFVPFLGAWIVPQTEVQGYLLEVVSLIGAMFLLLITGLETDLALIRRHARTAISVSFGGIVFTFATGFLLGRFLPDFLLADADARLVFALFVATAMSISAIPVIAKVLMDLNLMRRDVGQTILAAGMSDDTVGWILLSIVAGLAGGEAITAGSVLQIVGSVAAFMVLSFTVGRLLVRRLLGFVQDRAVGRDRLVTLVVVLTFAWGAITQALNLEAVLGAFVMGVIFGQMRRLPIDVHKKLETVALSIFTPVFFAVAGLKVDVQSLLTPQLIAITLLVILVASAGKVVGTYLGARLLAGRGHWNALTYGAGLNARGAMEIIIATIGLQLGILSQEMYSIIVVMAMVTSIMAPAALRFTLARVEPDQLEEQRLAREEIAAESLVANVHRVLLPVRVREHVAHDLRTIEAHLVDRLGSDLSVTLFNVAERGRKAEHTAHLNELAALFDQEETTVRVVEGTDPVDAILDEAAKDYDLIIMGASERGSSRDVLYNPVVDTVVRMAPCPTLVVKGGPGADRWPPKRILVPTNNSAGARHAADVAFALGRGGSVERVTLLTVVVQDRSAHRPDPSGVALERQLASAYGAFDTVHRLGEAYGTYVDTEVRVGQDPEEEVLAYAAHHGFDLIVLATDVRPGSDRLYLGPRVERILDGAPCPVVAVNIA